jgi:drug/metabolite transporter (DMT)-like permease
MEFLKSISQVVIALTQELSIFILAGFVLLIQPRTTQVNKIPIWHFVLFAIPLTLAVLLGLEGLKNTNPFHSLLIGLLTPIITLLLGVFFGKEILNLKSLPGLLIMIFGMLVFYL